MIGSIQKRKLPSGKIVWQVQLDAGRDESGKRMRISRNFSRKGEASNELTRLLQERVEGSLVKPSPKSFGEFLTEWLTEHAERNSAPKTAERYRQLLEYPIDALGEVPLRDLSTLTLSKFYGRLQDGKGKSGRKLSPRSIKHVHDTIRAALNTALVWRLLKINPAIACKLPRADPTEATVVEDAQLEYFISAAAGHPWMYVLLVTTSATGMRRGEILALTWPDIDLVLNSVEVSKSLEQTKAGLRIKRPKNGKTRRLTLPAVAADVLKQHRKAQQVNREAFGKDYRTDLDLVFATPEGEYLKPNTVSPAVAELAARVGLKGIGLHSLRHTHGSQLLAASVPLTVVSKRLGHSSVATTANIYAHAFTADEVKAAEVWDARLGEAIRHPALKPH